jgi:Cation transporter/ATPase, N-terminus
VTRPAAAPLAARTAEEDQPAWHVLTVDRVLPEEDVDARRGLDSAEVAARAQRFGQNTFDAGKGKVAAAVHSR